VAKHDAATQAEVFTTQELAERLGWKASQVSEMCRNGLIRAKNFFRTELMPLRIKSPDN